MHILIVEDERKIADFIKKGLKEEGYTVSIADNGEDGYHFAKLTSFDLILLDWMIPGMDGLTLCKKLRAEKNFTPILMLTAKDAVQNKVEGLDSGANDYLTKPFAFEELLARIRVLTRIDKNSLETLLSCGDLSLDLLTHQVKRGSKLIELTTREFALLEFLIRHIGQIITRTMIAEHVWDVNFDTNTNIIDVYINYLRKKIDSDYDRKLIHTIRGRGYCIKA